jgi:hypothetical protein
MQRVLPMLALVFSIALPAQGIAQDALRSDHVLYFAVGWRVNEPSAQNVLQLGTVFRCGDAWCLEYEEFPGKDNFSRTPLPYRHEMEAPYGKGRCINEHLTTIHGVIHGDVPAQLIEEENGFVIRADIYEYTWKRDISPAGGFVLASARETGSEVVFEQPIGFAYESEDQKGRQVRPIRTCSWVSWMIGQKNSQVWTFASLEFLLINRYWDLTSLAFQKLFASIIR